MNRKEFIKSLAGVAVIGAAAPALAQMPRYSGNVVPTGMPVGPTSMPPDTRTNDELWDDYVNEGVRIVEGRIRDNKHYTHYKWVGSIDRIGYDRVKKLIAEKGWTFTEQVRDGITTFEVEGVLFRLY